MVETWFRTVDSITFHDPLAAASIFKLDLCRFERGAVAIELMSEQLRGLTYWTSTAGDSRHEVATQVDSTTFFEHYFSVIC
jgi:purine nucleosidase